MTRQDTLRLGFAASALGLLAGCEVGTKQIQETGYRGLGLEQITDKSSVKKAAAIPPAPYPLPEDTGPSARESYQNVQVLGDMSAERFNHFMSAMSLWVAGDAGNCGYCHNTENFAADTYEDGRPIYTKTVARRMIQQTWALNGKWVSHVQNTGVTCWTCHRGQGVPANVWSRELDPGDITVRNNRRGQNSPNPNAAYASLPANTFDRFFAGDTRVIRVASNSQYPQPEYRQVSIKNAEASYGLMMHLSQSLGVNCTYCHNSQSFRSWSMSSPQRATAWYGIRMVRDINQNYIESLQNVFPAARKGPAGDVYKVNCLTCHQGQNKPMGGVSMLPDYPYLRIAGYGGPAPVGGTADYPGGAPGETAAAIPQGEGLIVGERAGSPLLTVYFATAQSGVTNQLAEEAARLKAFLDAHPGARVSVSGYVDPRGNAAMNAELAKNRAQNVRAALAEAGIGADRIDLDKPADIVGNTASLANDRRVEVGVKVPGAPAMASGASGRAADGSVPEALQQPGEMTDQSAATDGSGRPARDVQR